jgi:hypothetical protein
MLSIDLNTINVIIIIGLFGFYYTLFINNINLKINELHKKYDLLYQSLIKLKNIIHIDNETSHQLVNFRKELNIINKILKIKNSSDSNEDLNSNESEVNSNESEVNSNESEVNSNDSGTYSIEETKFILPIQTHIEFPEICIFNEKNFKQTKLSNNSYELKFVGNDLRLISNNLAKFLKKKCGTCIEFKEVYKTVFEYIQDKNIINLSDDNNLCKLFGISIYEDYEYTDSDLVLVLEKLLEPHFKKISYGCIICD